MGRSKKSKVGKKAELDITGYSHAKDTMKIIYGATEAVGKGIEFMNNVKKKMDLCYDKNAPSIVLDVKEYKNGYIAIRKRGGKIRVITEITKDNVEVCKELLNIVDEIRHLDNVQGGTAINEKEYMATNILHESKPLTQVVYSNVLDIVEQQQKFFDSLWKTAIPAKQKFREFTSKLNSKNIDLFSVLSSELRRSMMFYLLEEEMSTSQLSKKLEMTLQAMQKHLPKLLNAGIVEKRNDGTLALSQLGLILINQISSVEFLSENASYLKRHCLSSLPSVFLQRIGDLEKFEIINGKDNIEKIENFLSETEEYLKIITKQSYFDFDEETISKLENAGVRISQILDENSTNPKLKKEKSRKNTEKHEVKKIFERKTTKNVPLLTCVSEKSACLVFLNDNETIDVNDILWSKDQKFVSWCNDFFDHYWKLD